MIDSIRKGVVVILPIDSHVNVMECINNKKNVIKEKGNSVVLGNNTIALLLLSFSFLFFSSPSPSSYSLIADTNIHIYWPQSKKKRIVKFFFFTSKGSTIYKEAYDFDIFLYFISCLSLLSYRYIQNGLYLITIPIIIIEFEVKTKATDKEIEFLVCIASR
jgi:hypothetical protein